jgi:hypothetical protein
MMGTPPVELQEVSTTVPDDPDDALILAASWEERCLGVATRLRNYSAAQVFLSIYDGKSELREKHIGQLIDLLEPIGALHKVPAKHAYPIENVREIVALIRKTIGERSPRITVDISTFTKKHLLQLLQGLDLSGMLNNCRFLYTEPIDYHTQDDEPIAQGITSVKAVETFTGYNNPSRDSLLILFLGYEGRRALALWEHLEPNLTLAVIPDPPYHENWFRRTETQNHYLLSCLKKEQITKSHSLIPTDTEELLERLMNDPQLGIDKYNYLIAPLGTKAQTLGFYRFWRRHRGVGTVMYARPVRYREENATFPFGRTWLLDSTETWN